MDNQERLLAGIVNRVNAGLGKHDFEAGIYIRPLVSNRSFFQTPAYYGLTPDHPVNFTVIHSSLAGSYFAGKCAVSNAAIYRTDIRGDELKRKGQAVSPGDIKLILKEDETVRVMDSCLINTLVHNNSHDLSCPEDFLIQNVAAMPYANIHGSRVMDCFLGPFSTVDLTTVRNCLIGAWAYVQAGELADRVIEPGEILIQVEGAFEFHYRFPAQALANYVNQEPGREPGGFLMDLVKAREEEIQGLFKPGRTGPAGSHHLPDGSLSPFALVKGETELGPNVFVAQRAYLENARLGPGANAQENCWIINSRLAGLDVTAHGGKIVNADLGERVFVGFNAFLYGQPENRLVIGQGGIVMPQTIIDAQEPLDIPANSLVWGFIRNQDDLAGQSLSLEALAEVKGEILVGDMRFQGSGAAFVEAFRHRIEHILEENGAFFDGTQKRGHAQKSRDMAFLVLPPCPEGESAGLFPDLQLRSPV